MGNTHPLNHVLLYWLSAAPGKSRKHPSSVSPNFPLRFLSPYQEAISAISTQGRFFPQHDKRRLEVLISGSKIRNQNCSLKTSTARRSSSAFLRPEQDVQYGEVSRWAAPEKSKLHPSTSKNLWETQRRFGIDRMRAWKVHPIFRQFSDPSV